MTDKANDNDDDPESRRRRKIESIKSDLGKGEPAKPPRKRRATKPAADRSVSVRGNGNFVVNGNGDVNIHGPSPAPRPIVKVQTGVGVLTAEQKAEINRLFDEWFRLRGLVRKTGAEYKALRFAFNKHMRVNKYDEIAQADFGKATRWIRSQIAIINSMASAPKKVPDWRNGRYRSINARAKEFPDGEARYRRYTLDRFGASSLRDLDDEQLDAVYRHVFGWPRSR